MAEFFTNEDKRTIYCGDIRESDIGKEVTVCGWVQRQRDLGSLIFVLLSSFAYDLYIFLCKCILSRHSFITVYIIPHFS